MRDYKNVYSGDDTTVAGPLSDAEIEELKAWHAIDLNKLDERDRGVRYLNLAAKCVVVLPRLIAEIEAARRRESANRRRVAVALAEFQKSDCFTNNLTGMADEHHLRIWFDDMARVAISAQKLPEVPSAPPPGEGEIEALLKFDESATNQAPVFHTAFRHAGNSEHSIKAHTAIGAMTGEEWIEIVDYGTHWLRKNINDLRAALRHLTQPQNAAAGEDGK